MQRRQAVRAVILSETDNTVLLLRMKHPDRPGDFWLLPGGGVKPHESPVEALRRGRFPLSSTDSSPTVRARHRSPKGATYE
ncbi:MAG: NUDIX domain-containing protein [Gammaproteobacteria bacterium]|nr:NUDIX domain-containing protein [Gammaproteobacteria bacterium]